LKNISNEVCLAIFTKYKYMMQEGFDKMKLNVDAINYQQKAI